MKKIAAALAVPMIALAGCATTTAEDDFPAKPPTYGYQPERDEPYTVQDVPDYGQDRLTSSEIDQVFEMSFDQMFSDEFKQLFCDSWAYDSATVYADFQMGWDASLAGQQGIPVPSFFEVDRQVNQRC